MSQSAEHPADLSVARAFAKPVALGIDIGTSGIRLIGVDRTGAPCLNARIDLPGTRHDRNPDGSVAEQQPEDWWQGLDALLTETGQNGALADVRHIALAATSGTLLAGDAEGQPLSPALMYDDGRGQSGAPLERIRSWALPAHLNTSALCRWLWLRDQLDDPSALPWLQSDWLLHRLTGRRVSDANNALKFGYDPVARQWPPTLVKTLDERILPPVVLPGTIIGPIRSVWRTRWGLPEDAAACAGTTDSVAAVWASDARAPGDAVTSLGSTLALKLVSDNPVFDQASGVYSHVFGDRYLVSGASNSGGQVLRQFFDDRTLAELSSRIDPDYDPKIELGLDYWPLCGIGERFPINNPDFAPRMTPRPDDPALFLSALLHGIARIEQRGYDRFVELGGPELRQVFTSGGGAKNPVWRQIRERLLDVPVTVDHDGGSPDPALGAARLARQATPIKPDNHSHAGASE